MTPSPQRHDDPRRFALRAVALAFGVGLLLAVTASAGIAGERITRGALAAALVANVAVTLAAILAVVPTLRTLRKRLHPLLVLAPQVAGAVLGVVIVHALLRHELAGALPWLSEKPAQLVNDAVAVAGLLALVWAAARGLDARLLPLALVGITMYRLTASFWHLDAAPGGFQTTVQELVVAQLVAAAIALGLFRSSLDRRLST